jgi:hypothetical protein
MPAMSVSPSPNQPFIGDSKAGEPLGGVKTPRAKSGAGRSAGDNPEPLRRAARRKWALTPARLAASHRNLNKAHAAVRAGRRRFSERMMESSRKNLAKGRAILNARGRTPEHIEKLRQNAALARASHTPQSRIKQARKILSHGFYSRLLRDTAETLGENPADYDKLHKLVARYVTAANEQEARLTKALADALWRYHRLYFAQARHHIEGLLFFLSEARPPLGTYEQESSLRAYDLLMVLLDQNLFHQREWRMLGAIERLMRRFIRLRTGKDAEFKTRFYPKRLERDPLDNMDRILDRMDRLMNEGIIEYG